MGHIGDGADPRVLEDAGPYVANVAVVSLTDSDRTNRVTAVKLCLESELFVRSEHDDTTRNLLVGTEHVWIHFGFRARSGPRISQPLHYGLIDQLLDPTQTTIEVPKPVDDGRGSFVDRPAEDPFAMRWKLGLSVHIVDPAVRSSPAWVRGWVRKISRYGGQY